MRQNNRMSVEQFFERYERARLESGLSEKALMKEAGLKVDALRNARRRMAMPDLFAVVKIAHILNVSPFHFLEPLGFTRDFLKGSVTSDTSSELIDDPAEIAWIGLWRDMDDTQRRHVLSMVGGLLGRTSVA